MTCPKYNVGSYPTLILIQDGQIKAQYNGNRELGDLIEFVTINLGEQPKVNCPVYHNVIMYTSHFFQEPPVPGVKVLTGDDFDSTISAGTTFVKFYAPW